MTQKATAQTTQAVKAPVAVPHILLQRACACSQHTPGGGECAECRKKVEPTLQRSAAGPPPVSTRGLIGQDFSRISVHSARPGVLQAQLAISTPGDRYEQEADRVAAAVVGGGIPNCPVATSTSLQRKESSVAAPITAPPIVHDVLRAPGHPLDAATRAFMEPRFGQDFSGVRVHTDAQAAASARAVHAHAYTVGKDVAFAEGQFAPGTAVGKRLLAHELAHVVQQQGMTAQAPGQPKTGPAPLSLQRAYVEEPSGGCGVCMDPTAAGQEVHTVIQAHMTGQGVSSEQGLLFPDSEDTENGRLDLIRITKSPTPPFETFVEIGEIKPYNASGVKGGHKQLAKYKRQVQAAMGLLGVNSTNAEVSFLDAPAPPLPMPLPEPLSRCPQEINVEGPFEGLYLYSCAPPCSSCNQQTCCGPAPNLAPILVLLVALIAAAAAAALKKAGKSNPVYAFITLLAVAAVIMLSEQQAKAGENPVDDDPLVAVAQMFEDTGQPMPPEIRKLIADDPALRELLRIEVERRRRNRAKSDTTLPPGASGTDSGTTPNAADTTLNAADTTPNAAGAGTANTGATPGSGGLDKPASKPSAVAGDQKAAVPSPDVPGRPDEKENADKKNADATNSYWQSVQGAMNGFDYSALGPNNAQIVWPPEIDRTKLQPKQQVTCFVYGQSSGAKYAVGLTVEVVSRTGQSTTVRVQWCGGLLTSSGQRLPPPSAYHPGAVIIARDPAGQ